jgi:hypothetical protein
VRILRKFHFAPDIANTIYIQGKQQHTNTQFTYYNVIIFNDPKLLFTPSQVTNTVRQIRALACSHTAYQTCRKLCWLICRCYSKICDIHHLWDQTATHHCFTDIRTLCLTCILLYPAPSPHLSLDIPSCFPCCTFISLFIATYIKRCTFIHSFFHSTGMCRMRRLLAVLRSFFHSSLLHTISFHPFPPTILPSSLTSSYDLFLGLPLNIVVPKFIYSKTCLKQTLY